MSPDNRAPKDQAVVWLQADLRDTAAAMLRSMNGLAAFTGRGAAAVEKAHECIAEVLKVFGVDLESGAQQSYAGLTPREAAALDLELYGEGRTIEEVEQHVFEMGFPKERNGQIRSSINATANRGVYFEVSGVNEKVSLLPAGKELAKKLKSHSL